jgi:opacity protein-like surface antigen
MSRLAVAVFAIFLINSFAVAQDSTPKVEVFGGYSFVHADAGKLTAITLDVTLREPSNAFAVGQNFQGWNAEGQYNFDRWVGVVADFGGRSGKPITGTSAVKISGLPDLTAYSYLFGPVVSYCNKSRMTPFVHALFGYDRDTLGAGTLTGLPTPVSIAKTTYTDFAVALGGGLDYKIVSHVALRGQIDWYHTSLNLTNFYNSALGPNLLQGLATRERNVRFAAGVVISF